MPAESLGPHESPWLLQSHPHLVGSDAGWVQSGHVSAHLSAAQLGAHSHVWDAALNVHCLPASHPALPLESLQLLSSQ